MRKYIFTFITLLTLLSALFSCGDSYDSNLKTMSDTFKRQLEDSLFKANATLKIYKSNVIGYDTIDDSYFMKDIRETIVGFISSEESFLSEFKEMSSPFGERMNKDEANNIRGYEKRIRDLKAIVDSIDWGKYKKSGKHFYLYKEYLKASVISSNGKKENIIDTLHIAFNQNLERLNNVDKYPHEITRVYNRALSIFSPE